MLRLLRVVLTTWLHARRESLARFRSRVHRRINWPGLHVHEPVVWLNDDSKCISIGQWVQIGQFSEIVVLANSPNSAITGKLLIGDRTYIGVCANIRATGGVVSIGRDCLIGQSVSIIGCNHLIKDGQPYCDQPWDTERTGVSIGNNVWIGCGSTILPGCAIGDNVVIGAGSIVTKSIPAGSIWAGNPAREVRKR
jgi:acetyltransferase-like isoleucine patch superfamily enzyme